jgi:low affinity Fe/Cu permease
MVFIIQQSQNKDSIAVHLKLNELISANDKSSDFLISIEDLTEEDLQVIRRYYEKMAELSKKKAAVKDRYSEDEALRRVNEKFKGG